MKKILRILPYVVISVISFTVISIMDLVWILAALCIKATRSIFIWLQDAFDPDDYIDFNGRKNIVNVMVNYGYKYYIDLMYPVEEDFEDEDEDE